MAARLSEAEARRLLGRAAEQPSSRAAERRRGNKYNVAPRERRTLDGVLYDSRKEMQRAAELELQQRTGLIRDLRHQVRYPLDVGGYRIGVYVADALYTEAATGACVVEDTKGKATREYKMKKKLMRALYGIEIREV